MEEKRKVLVVDDNQEIREILHDFLDLNGFDTYCAENSANALDFIKKVPFDIIISDYSMPGMNGAELVKTVRFFSPDALIIGMSAFPNGKIFLAAGADAFLLKPVSPKQLLAAVMPNK